MRNFFFWRLYFCKFLALLLIGLFKTELEAEVDLYSELPEQEKLLYKFINCQGEILGKKYRLNPIGNGVGGMDKIWIIHLIFDRLNSPINENQARELIVHCVNDFLEAINNDEQLRPLLENYPFTAKNIDLKIFNFNNDRDIQPFPSMGIISNYQGKISYLTKLSKQIYGYHTEKYETFEEAVANLKKISDDM